jgi:HK97 gp10 family phage protein
MAQETTKIAITGMQETLDIFRQLADEIGDKKATSKILQPAVKEAMQPVLRMAQIDAPKGETGLLTQSLGITARRPTSRDRRSMYVSSTDAVIAVVQSKRIPRSLKSKFDNENASVVNNYLYAGDSDKDKAYKDLRRAKRKFYAQHGLAYDARVTAMEFGTSHVAARPFLRKALESQAQDVARRLGEILNNRMSRFIAKLNKTGAKL